MNSMRSIVSSVVAIVYESDNMCDVLSNLENIMSECDRIGDLA